MSEPKPKPADKEQEPPAAPKAPLPPPRPLRQNWKQTIGRPSEEESPDEFA